MQDDPLDHYRSTASLWEPANRLRPTSCSERRPTHSRKVRLRPAHVVRYGEFADPTYQELCVIAQRAHVYYWRPWAVSVLMY